MRSLSGLLIPWVVLTVQNAAAIPHHFLEDAACGLKSIFRRDGAANLPVPSQDSFYVPPANWASASPGDVLATRNSAYKSITIGNCMDTFQVMYRSTDSNNAATWGTATVFIPATNAKCNTKNPTNCAHAIVSYELPYDTCNPDASASYQLQFGEPYGDMYDLLTRGYFVSVPDFEGPFASYGAGVQAGHSTLDSLRAVLKVVGDHGFQTTKARTALWGYSGGAVATAFAAELAGTYAPDLKINGIAHGGISPNVITSGSQTSNVTGFTGLVIASILGITSQHTAARSYINSKLKTKGPENSTYFYTATAMSGSQLISAFPNTNVVDFFTNGATDLSNQVLIDMYLADAVLGSHGVPKMSMFVYEAVSDELSPISSLDSLVTSYCSQGGNVLYHRNRVGGHNQELFAGRPRVLEYFSTILDDTTALSVPKTGCQTTNVTIAVNVTLVQTTAVEGSTTVPYKAVTITPIKADVMADGTVVDTTTSKALDIKGLMKTWASSITNFQISVGGISPLDTFTLAIGEDRRASQG